MTQRSTTAVDASFVQWGASLVIPNPGMAVDLALMVNGVFGIGAAVGATLMSARVDYSLNGGSTWDTSGPTAGGQLNSAASVDIDSMPFTAMHFADNVTPTGDIHIRAMTQRTVSASGAANFQGGRIRADIQPA